MIKIAVPGINGRMGLAVAEQVLQAPDLTLAVATTRSGNPLPGIASNLADSKFDVLIDFTLPAGVMEHLTYCLQHNVAMVIGSTGFSAEQLHALQQAAKKIPILLAANMSIGVNICYKLLATAAKLFDNTWQVQIIDVHHQHKKDAPSGTAKHMASVIAEASGRDLASIVIHSERRGEIIGEHTVTFTNATEQVAIAHVSMDRNIYALGALTAARWLVGQQAGFYTMQEVVV